MSVSSPSPPASTAFSKDITVFSGASYKTKSLSAYIFKVIIFRRSFFFFKKGPWSRHKRCRMCFLGTTQECDTGIILSLYTVCNCNVNLSQQYQSWLRMRCWLQEKVSLQSGTVTELESAANEHGDQLTNLQDTTAKLSATVESLGKKCEELEACSRWHNIQLTCLIEGSDGPWPTESMAELLNDLLGLDEKPGLDRTHCTLCAKPWRAIMFDGHQGDAISSKEYFSTWSFPLPHNGKMVHIFPDFTLTMAKRRVVFVQVKLELLTCVQLKFGLLYPVTLHITM